MYAFMLSNSTLVTMPTITVFITLALLCPVLSYKTFVAPLKLRIVHNNDFMYKLNGFQHDSGCIKANESCRGGAFQLISAIINLRQDAKDTKKDMLYLYAGNTLGDSIYNTLTKTKAITYFLNAIQPDVMCLGMTDFNYGVRTLKDMLINIKSPIVASNVDSSKDNDMKGVILHNSYILKVRNTKIGFVGYINADTPKYSNSHNVTFTDEFDSIRRESNILRSNGVQLIIAIGNGNYDVTKRIAESAPLVDLVVSGSPFFKATKMWNTVTPKISETDYPVFTIKNGKKIAILQLSGYGKYLGVIDITLDQTSTLMSYNYTLDKLTSPNTWGPLKADGVIDDLNAYIKGYNGENIIGHTRVQITAHKFICFYSECLFGNMITDAIVDYIGAQQGINMIEKKYWTTTPIAIINAGAMSSGLGITDGNVSYYELFESINMPSSFSVLKVSGRLLYTILEKAVQQRALNRNFLHFSGLRVIYDYSKRPNNRVVQLKALCGQCWIPIHSTVKMSMHYNITIPTFLFDQVEDLALLKKKGELLYEIKVNITEMVLTQFKLFNFLTPTLDRRILILNSSFMFSMNVLFVLTMLIVCFLIS